MEAKRVAFDQRMLLRYDYGFTKGTPTLVLLQALVSALFDHIISLRHLWPPVQCQSCKEFSQYL